MLWVLALAVLVLGAIVIIRIGTVALMMTGLSEEVAYFQSLSALTGTGFTTEEAETIADHPVRRNIAKYLILTGNAGTVGVISALVLSFTQAQNEEQLMRNGIMLGAAVLVLFFVSRNQLINRWLQNLIRGVLERTTQLHTRDFHSILEIERGYRVISLEIGTDSELCGKTLAELELAEHGVIVLGITHEDGTYEGAPKGSQKLEAGDDLLCYGRLGKLKSFAQTAAHTETSGLQTPTLPRSE